MMRPRVPYELPRDSFLRRVDPRTKLFLCAATSAAVMLPLAHLAAVMAGYFLLILAARIERQALAQLRRAAVLLTLLFLADWLWIGLGFAALIAARLTLLIIGFSLFFATTTPDELQAALEQMRVPTRLAFAFAAAYRFLGLLGSEWQEIVEAQQARGIVFRAPSWRAPRQSLAWATAIIVPAVVLATQRAWSITEAAAARGFESPSRRCSRRLRFSRVDQLLVTAAVGVIACLFAYR
jgi:energy-coupling factor transporter transmembrane protein EcfT